MGNKIIPWILLILWSTLPAPGQEDQKINQRIQEINRKLEELDKTKDSILDQIYNVELRYEKQVIIRNNLENKIRKIKQRILRLEKEEKSLADRIEEFKEEIRKVLRILYKTGGNTYLKLFLRIDNFNQLFQNYHLFVSLVNYKSSEIDQTREAISQLIEVKRSLNREREELKRNSDLQTRHIRQLHQVKESRISLLEDINNDKRTYIQHLNELKLQAEKLDNIITQRKNIFKTKRINLSALKKKIRWPLKGRVISTFGRKKSKKFDTYTMNNGIEIAPVADESIKSVLPGTVVFADYFKGYGNTIIIQHAVDLFSLYGRCRKLYVQQGQRVEEGELIALVGDSGSLQGTSLYFEIRINVQAQNPLNWLEQ